MRDLYALLWCFERIDGGPAGDAIDKKMLSQLIGTHAVWWDELCREMTTEDTRHVTSLGALAHALETPELWEWAQAGLI